MPMATSRSIIAGPVTYFKFAVSQILKQVIPIVWSMVILIMVMTQVDHNFVQ